MGEKSRHRGREIRSHQEPGPRADNRGWKCHRWGSRMVVRLWLVVLVSCMVLSSGGVARGEPPASSPGVEQAIVEAMDLYRMGEVDAAIFMLQQVEKKDPKNTRVLFKLGELALKAKNWAYAIEVLRKAADLQPADVDTRMLLMHVYRAYQMPIQEIMAGREIIAVNPRHVEALRRLAFLYEDQDMLKDEQATRKRLADVDPANYENLKRLAFIFEDEVNIWEAVRVYQQIVEHFPDKAEDARTLGRLRGDSYDRYGEVIERRRALGLPGGGNPGEVNACKAPYFQHKRNLRLGNPFLADLVLSQDVSPVDRIQMADVTAAYERVFLLTNLEFLLGAHVRTMGWFPLTPEVAGNRPIVAHGATVGLRNHWDDGHTSLEGNFGYENVSVSGSTQALSPLATPDQYPFLEKRSFGGTMLVGDLALDHRFSDRFSGRLEAFHRPIDEIDAYVRMMSAYGATATLRYDWPSRAFATTGYNQSWFSDGNVRNHAFAEASVPIYMSDPLRDLDGHTRRYLYTYPDHQLKAGYHFDYIHDAKESYLYQSYALSDELRHLFTLTGQHRLGRSDFFLYYQGVYGFGRVEDMNRGFRAGFVYEEDQKENFLRLTYGTLDTNTIDQINPRYDGGSRQQGFQLEVIWHFDDAPGKGAEPRWRK